MKKINNALNNMSKWMSVIPLLLRPPCPICKNPMDKDDVYVCAQCGDKCCEYETTERIKDEVSDGKGNTTAM